MLRAAAAHFRPETSRELIYEEIAAATDCTVSAVKSRSAPRSGHADGAHELIKSPMQRTPSLDLTAAQMRHAAARAETQHGTRGGEPGKMPRNYINDTMPTSETYLTLHAL